jgi:hypothetical protein
VTKPEEVPVAKKKSIYGVHAGVLMTQKWIASLKDKTGRSLEEWLALVAKKGPGDEAGRRDWFKREHGLGTNSARWLAERSFGKGIEDGDPDLYLRAAEGYVLTMFVGKKAALRPLYRKHVFDEIKPSTNTRIDFGLALGDTRKTPKRLIDSGGFAKKNRITHRFAITTATEIDDEVKRWAKAAYDRDL